jgi:DNA-binding MarR family transcriptional regulator
MARYGRDSVPEPRHERTPVRFPEPVAQDFPVPATSERGAGGGSADGSNDDRNKNRERELDYELRRSGLDTLRDIGVFRSLAVEDLTKYRYVGNPAAAKHHLDSLLRNGLIQRRTSYPDRTAYVTLTPRGHRLLLRSEHKGATAQRFYHGFVKRREAKHDAALYRLYQQEVERIEQAGGRVERVILDFELRRSINRRLASIASLPRSEQDRVRQGIAESHGLKVVSGKIPLPDLRLEYEGPGQDMAKVDLELVTHHYHHNNLVAKAKAGFAMYASAEDAMRLRPAMADPEIMQDILSL